MRMNKRGYVIILFYSLQVFMNLFEISNAQAYKPPFNRSAFSRDFIFGAATAAYQIEGAAREGGRGPSIWDTFTRDHPEKIWDRSTGDVAVDFYHRYKGDIKLLKQLGMDAFRLSISWTRILPRGKINGGVNLQGIRFYNDVINELISQGITPFVTLHHWDVPQALEDEYGGFLSPKIVNDFRDFVEVCFKEFGDRVKHWITLNEPLTFSMNGYATGTMAPGRCSNKVGASSRCHGYATGTMAPGRCSNFVGNCTRGNSGTEPYIVAHHLILAHAAAVRVYKDKYQKYQKGEIGITLVSHWFVPRSPTLEDLRASYRAIDFFLGWFLHPITYGDYPSSMRRNVGRRLPRFTQDESKLIKGSIDFLGINYYTSNYASPAPSVNNINLSYTSDNRAILSSEKDGVPIGTPTDLNWLFIYPKGIRELMLYIMKNYNNPPIYITENGMAETNNSTLPVEEAIKDEIRIKYYEGHLWYLQKAIKEGANVKGHFAWAFLDDFEWDAGFSVRFGLNYIDYQNRLKRIPKLSYYWFKKFLKKSTK